jgi:hypothetical protein
MPWGSVVNGSDNAIRTVGPSAVMVAVPSPKTRFRHVDPTSGSASLDSDAATTDAVIGVPSAQVASSRMVKV